MKTGLSSQHQYPQTTATDTGTGIKGEKPEKEEEEEEALAFLLHFFSRCKESLVI